jgi:hypothetical protein
VRVAAPVIPQTDNATMHSNTAINLGCTDCHGGNAGVTLAAGLTKNSPEYRKTMDSAHVLPRYPSEWHYPSSANPQRSYTLLNREAPEFIRFVNPSDYRVARESCGACHSEIIEASMRSLHGTAAMFWGGASYNNGILDFKNYILGESYNRDGDRHDPEGTGHRSARRLRRGHRPSGLSIASLGDHQARRYFPHLRARWP